MEDYFVMFVKADKGAPISLEAVIQSTFNPKDPFRGHDGGDSDEWNLTLHEKVVFPPELWLITKDRMYSFDYRPYPTGFIVSQQMVDLLVEFDVHNYVMQRLQVVNKRQEPIKAKEYYFLKFTDCLTDAIDLKKSKFDLDKKYGYIKKYHEVYLTDSVKPAVFVVDARKLGNNMFCSQAFEERAIQVKLHGITFAPIKDADDYKKYW